MLGCSLLDQPYITLELMEEAGALVAAGWDEEEEEVVCAGSDELDDGA
jgi:hypothetical protein